MSFTLSPTVHTKFRMYLEEKTHKTTFNLRQNRRQKIRWLTNDCLTTSQGPNATLKSFSGGGISIVNSAKTIGPFSTKFYRKIAYYTVHLCVKSRVDSIKTPAARRTTKITFNRVLWTQFQTDSLDILDKCCT